ncbi:MAG: aquaporin [Verrucomicrobiota bacterium]|nr:aquaporin [Verrucomicrobiota bacterium]
MENETYPLRTRLGAELLGTYILVFTGTAAIAVDSTTNSLGLVGISLVFGLVVMAMICSFGDISGAHFNPAVSLAFYAARRLGFQDFMWYSLFQGLGAIAGSLTVRLLIGPETLGESVPANSWGQACVMEFILSFILMTVIFNVSSGAKEKGITAGIAIGGTIALNAMVGGMLSGASTNPARSLGPALISGNMGNLWIYFVGPILGMLAAVLICRCHRSRECC